MLDAAQSFFHIHSQMGDKNAHFPWYQADTAVSHNGFYNRAHTYIRLHDQAFLHSFSVYPANVTALAVSYDSVHNSSPLKLPYTQNCSLVHMPHK